MMTVFRVWKRIRCPCGCNKLIRVRYATDGTWVLQDSKPSLHPPSEQCEHEEFSETQLKVLAELIAAAINKHTEEYVHKETPLTKAEMECIAERDEESAQTEREED